MSGGLTESQLTAMVVTERFNSCLSVLGIFFVLGTYLYFPYFDKPINRLIFFASWANLGTNVASLISQQGPLAGQDAALCQFQGFLVQMFLGVDCYWAFCMAINVYLVFFRGYSVQQLRSLDLRYLLICYGASFLPAFVFIFIDTQERGRIYGDATIWCWITVEWDFLRIVMLYGIVWIAMIVAAVVYGMAGKVIWDKRKHLDGFLNPLNENPFTNTITTEVQITHQDRPMVHDSESTERMTSDNSELSELPAELDAYSVQIEVAQQMPDRNLPAALRMRSTTRDAAKQAPNAEAWLYARVAFLFFIALLITWVPSSINRIYSLAWPTAVNFPLNYISSFVFPLQGFWNAIVYIITSQSATHNLLHRVYSVFSGHSAEGNTTFEDKYTMGGISGSVGSAKKGGGSERLSGRGRIRIPMWGAKQQRMGSLPSFT